MSLCPKQIFVEKQGKDVVFFLRSLIYACVRRQNGSSAKIGLLASSLVVWETSLRWGKEERAGKENEVG